MNNDIVLQLTIIGIISDINVRIDVLVGHPLEDLTVTAPFGRIATDKIVIIAGQWFIRCNSRLFVTTYEGNPIGMRTKRVGRIETTSTATFRRRQVVAYFSQAAALDTVMVVGYPVEIVDVI